MQHIFDVNIGDTVLACPVLLTLEYEQGRRQYTPIPGTVIFIHPAGRYIVLEFAFRGSKIREAFPTRTKKELDELCAQLPS